MQFYINRLRFERERELLNDPATRRLLPATIDTVANAAGKLRAPNGYVWPPCVIMKWCMPLNYPGWQQRPHGEHARALAGAAAAVAAVHARGLVHRNLAPSNVVLDTAGRVALVDFGCAAEQGEMSRTLLIPSWFAIMAQCMSVVQQAH